MIGDSLNPLRNTMLLESETAQGVIDLLVQIKHPISVISPLLQANNGNWYMVINSEKKLTIIKQEN